MQKENESKVIPPTSTDLLKSTLVKQNGNDKQTVVNYGNSIPGISGVAINTATKLKNNTDIMELFPDIDLATMILVSTIVSPKDMLTDALNIKHKGNVLPSNVSSIINSEIKTYVNKTYKLEESLYTVVEKALVTEGAYIEVFIPTSNLSKLTVDVGDLESYIDKETSQVTDSDLLYVSDDVGLLDIRTSTLDDIDTESIMDSMGIKETEVVKFAALSKVKRPTVEITDYDDSALLRKVIPTTAVVPLASKDNPSNHYGYFVLLDEKGAYVNMEIQNGPKGYLDMSSSQRSNAIIDALAARQTTRDNSRPLLNSEDLIDNLITSTITDHFNESNKSLAGEFEFSQNVYDVMFKRIMSQQKTRLVFLPAHLVTYFAFNYRKDGTGKSLLEKLAPLASMRATMLITRLNAAIENSITKVKVNLKLDDTDPNPAKTAEMVRDELIKSKMGSAIIGMLNIDDLTRHLHNTGIYMEVEHESLPDMKLDFTDISSDKKEPDESLYDSLKEDTAKVFGLSPELIEKGFDSDFAISAAMNSALFARRILMFKSKLDPVITKYYKIISRFDVMLKTKIQKIIKNNLAEMFNTFSSEFKEVVKKNKVTDDELVTYLYLEYIDNLHVNTSKVVLDEDNGLAMAYEVYKTEIEDYVETYISEEAIPNEVLENIDGDIGVLQAAIKHTLLRKWMTDNGYQTDLVELFTTDDIGNTKLDVLGEYSNYTANIVNALKKFNKINKKSDKSPKE